VLDADAARTSIKRGVQFLLDKQNKDGSWGTSTPESLFELNYSNASFYAWKMAGGALSILTLMRVDETPERRAALENALNYILENDKPSAAATGTSTTTGRAVHVLDARRCGGGSALPGREVEVAHRGARREYAQHLLENQDPKGGWGYYEGPVVSRRPTWSTSFATALVIPSLVEAKTKLGWPIDDKMIARSVEYVRSCALPNGAYEYDLSPIPRVNGGESINDVKGSLGRIQICNWARRKAATRA
jgi:hypothetical protein